MNEVSRRMKKKYLGIIFGGAVVLAVVIGLVANTGQKNIEYSPESKTNKSGPIVIKAKSKISTNTGTYSIAPSVKGDLQVIDNYIIFWPADGDGYLEDTTYTAEFKNYKTDVGEELSIPLIRFKIDKEFTYSKLQLEVLEKYGRFEQEANPFLSKLPHTEPYRYHIYYDVVDVPDNKNKSTVELLGNEKNWREKRNNYTVFIETLVFQGRDDSSEVYRQEVQLARQEALDWIRQQGVDVEKDIYYVFSPSLDSLPATTNNDEDGSRDFSIPEDLH